MIDDLLNDLRAEHESLDELVADLSDDGWSTPTLASGWAVHDQIAHLAYVDEMATVAVRDEAAFRALNSGALREQMEALDDASLLAQWRQSRNTFIDEISRVAAADPKRRVPWFGPPMSLSSKITARLMETWAHGQDVADALGVTRTPTARLRHVAHIGAGTRGWAYAQHDLPAPTTTVRIELTAPDGDTWVWGPSVDEADDVIVGPALDFCLLVTQRIHRADTALVGAGPHAEEWLGIAQCFAGRPGVGRPPRKM